MLELVFVKLLETSIQASFLISAVLLIRFCFKHLSKRYICILWVLVAVRLILPFEITSPISLVPDTGKLLDWTNNFLSVEKKPENIDIKSTFPQTSFPDQESETQKEPLYTTEGIPNVPAGSEEHIPQTSENFSKETSANLNIVDLGTSAEPIFSPQNKFLTTLLPYIWFVGTLVFLTYGITSCLRLKWKLRTAVHAQDNIWYSEQIPSPFVLGYLKPRIYVPFSIHEEQLPYIIAHEQAHISHLDHLSKSFAALLLNIYWFNPFIWVAYLLYCKDLELACDERVIQTIGTAEKKAYSEALLICSVSNKALLQSPLAFSEVAIKDRIVNILNYKKPGFWSVMIALVLCGITGICFLTSPESQEKQLDEKTLEFIEQTTTELLDQVTVTYLIADGFHELPDTLSPDAYYLISGHHKEELRLYGLINGEAMLLRDGDAIYPLYDIPWPVYSSEIPGNTTDINLYKLDYDADGTEEYGICQYKYDENKTPYGGLTILEIEKDSLRVIPFTLSDMQEQLERISFEYSEEDGKIHIFIDSKEQDVLSVAWINKIYEQDPSGLISHSRSYIQAPYLQPELPQLHVSFGFGPPENESKSYVSASFLVAVTYSADGSFLLGDITIDHLSDNPPNLVTQYSTQLDAYPGTAFQNGTNQFIVTVTAQDYGCLVATDPDTNKTIYVWPDDYTKENVERFWPEADIGKDYKDYPLEIVNGKVREVPAKIIPEHFVQKYAFGAEVLEITNKLHPYGIKQYILRENGTLHVNIGYEAPDHLVFQYLTFQIGTDGETVALKDKGSGYYLLQLMDTAALEAFRDTYTGEEHVLPNNTSQLPWDWLLELNGEENNIPILKESQLPKAQQDFQFTRFAEFNLSDCYNGFLVSEKVINGKVFTEFRYQDGVDDIIILTDIGYGHVVSITFNGEEKPLPEYSLVIATGGIGGSYDTVYYLDLTGDGKKDLIFTGGYRQSAYCYVFDPQTMKEYPIDTDVSDITSKLQVTLTDFEPAGGKLSFNLAYENLSVHVKEKIIFSFDKNSDTTKMTLEEANNYFCYNPDSTFDEYIAYDPEGDCIETYIWIPIDHAFVPSYIGYLHAQYIWDESQGKFTIDMNTVSLVSISGELATTSEPDTNTPKDTFTETGTTSEELPVRYPDFYPGTTQYLKDIAWKNVSARITEEENEALQKYLPILTEDENFIWIYEIKQENHEYTYAKKQVSIRELLADQYDVLGTELIEPVVDSFCFADLFQTGNLDFILHLENYSYQWLIFHEEDGIIYCIYQYERWFHYPYTNGVYTGSGGAADTSYQRMSFENGSFSEEQIGRIIMNELYIDGVKQSAAAYEAWKEKYLSAPQVPYYTPIASNDSVE